MGEGVVIHVVVVQKRQEMRIFTIANETDAVTFKAAARAQGWTILAHEENGLLDAEAATERLKVADRVADFKAKSLHRVQ